MFCLYFGRFHSTMSSQRSKWVFQVLHWQTIFLLFHLSFFYYLFLFFQFFSSYNLNRSKCGWRCVQYGGVLVLIVYWNVVPFEKILIKKIKKNNPKKLPKMRSRDNQRSWTVGSGNCSKIMGGDSITCCWSWLKNIPDTNLFVVCFHYCVSVATNIF